MLDYLFKRPMLLTGICCSMVSFIGFYNHSALIFIMLSLSFLIGLLIYKKADRKLILISALIFAMCINCAQTLKRIDSLSYYGGNSSKAQLTVMSIDYRGDDYYIATARVVKSDTLPENIKLTVFYEPVKLEEGCRISTDIRVKKIDDRNSKMRSYSDGIYLKGNLSNIKIINGKDDYILKGVAKIKDYIKTQLFANLRYSEASTLCALIFGNTDYFTNEFYGYVKAAGVSHVMVVSGLHLSIIITLLVRLLERVLYNRYIKAFTIIFAVIFLCLICGFTMSIMRAGITYLIMAIGIMLDRKGKGENSLGAAITVILFFTPFAIFSVALQLSSLSTFGILAIALPVTDYIKDKSIFKKPILLNITSSALITLSATLLTLPVIINIFGFVSTVFLISNLLITPVVRFALYASIGALILEGLFPFLSPIIYIPAGLITRYINEVIEFFGSMPFATLTVPKFVSLIVAFVIFLLFGGLLACKKRRNMLRLEGMRLRIIKEGGRKVKWR